MKQTATPILVAGVVLALLSACKRNRPEHVELFERTDAFVTSLDTEVESYGLAGREHTVTTRDGRFQVMPVGRLVNVKMLKHDTDETYESLRETLEDRYRKDRRVNEVYISKGGTLMIDCRN
jgi:hypothetical protein